MSFNLLDFTFIESDSGPDSGSDDERLCAQNPAGYEAGDAHNPIQISDDEEVQPHDVPIVPRPPQHLAAADCVQLIRGILTDISVEYAENEVRDRQINTAEACEELIGVLVDAQTYPKQSNNTNQAKRKRPEDGDEDEEDEESRMAKFRKASLSRDYFGNA